jgi:hypothetical protein
MCALVVKSQWVFLIGDSLWRNILIAKYTEPGIVIDYICQQRKSASNVSCQWRALMNAFPLIDNFLAWKVEPGW